MNLNKVREYTVNEMIKKTTITYPNPREYDLVVRLDNIMDPDQESVLEIIGEDKKDSYTLGFIKNATPPKKINYKIL